MKNNHNIRSLFGRIRTINLFFSFAAFAFVFISCSKEEMEVDTMENFTEDLIVVDATTRSASSGTVIQEIPFSAVAAIGYCHGENIAFGGMIQNRVSKTTDANEQVHYTRSFTARGMTGTGTVHGTVYDVIGGAEMFAVKNPVFTATGMLDVSGSLAQSDILIHQGTLVFQSRTDGSRVVARHIIRKVPGKNEYVNKWVCAGN